MRSNQLQRVTVWLSLLGVAFVFLMHFEITIMRKEPNLPSFRELASRAITDKFGHNSYNNYQWAYEKYLVPLRFSKPKLVEIGLGCNMGYGPEKSVEFWYSFFHPPGEIWMFEYNSTCLDDVMKKENFPKFNGFAGDQTNEADLKRFLELSGGDFDIVIDDGSHEFIAQTTSLQTIFPYLRSGGIFFIEDLYCNFMKDNSFPPWKKWRFGSFWEKDNNTMKLISSLINFMQSPALINFEKVIGKTAEEILNVQHLPPLPELNHKLVRSIDCFHGICAIIRN